MMDLSDSKDDETNNQKLSVVKLKYELDRALQSYKFNELIWHEKENSLNSIIAEQKQVISLLESVLKGSQQHLDGMHASLNQKDDALRALNQDIEDMLAKTAQQIEALKANIHKAEQALAHKDAELSRCLAELAELNAKFSLLQRELDGIRQEQQRCIEKLSFAEQDAARLKAQKDEYESTAIQAQKKYGMIISELEKTKQDLGVSAKSIEAAVEKNSQIRREYEQKLAQVKQETLAISKRADGAAQATRQELDNANKELADVKYQLSQTKALFEKQNNEHNLLVRKHDQISTELDKQRAQTQIKEAELLNEQQVYRVLQKEFTDLTDKYERNKVNLTGLFAREAKYKLSIDDLKEQIEREKENSYQTISYQLGYSILQAGKSFRGFLRLPTELVRIKKEAKRRKIAKMERKRVVVEEKSSFVEPHSPIGQNEKQEVVLIESTKHKRLKLAAIMDEFTYHSYEPEAEVLQLHPEKWKEQLEQFKPDMFFIESAWNGLDGLWKTKISNADPEIIEAIDWCKSNGVPTLFWNKEDPVHFSTFIPIASRVDAVFTTDVDCLPKYKQAVGHDRVYLLPFAAQPKTHNPIEKYQRKDAFNFAGSYYLRYPERQRDFASIIDTVSQYKPLDIYDRNYDNPHPHYIFPEKYHKYILGKLAFDEIDKAYKGYRYGINMNTIKQSQTMFARRVFELLGSNTVVVSNFSRGVRTLFGDLVISSDHSEELGHRLQKICTDEVTYRKFRLLGLRKVMSEHTYGVRLAYIRAKVFNQTHSMDLPLIYVVAKIGTQADYDAFVRNVDRQQYNDIRKIVISENSLNVTDDVTLLKSPDQLSDLLDRSSDGSYFAFMSNHDYYGANYLKDLALAERYSEAVVYGKRAVYSNDDTKICLHEDGAQYQISNTLAARCSIVKAKVLNKAELGEISNNIDNYLYNYSDMLALDEFNYCRDGITLSDDYLAIEVGDLLVVNQGVSLREDISEIAGNVAMVERAGGKTTSLPELSAEDLFKFLSKPASGQIELEYIENQLHINSTLPVDKFVYLYSRKIYTRAQLNMVLNSQFKLECETTAQLKTVFEFQDSKGVKIAHAMNAAGDFNSLAIPEHCRKIRFGLRVQGPGDIKINKLVLGSHGQKPVAIVGNSPYLVLTKQYPSYDDLYKYGFLHTRVRAYKENGLAVDVFRITNEDGNSYREFEDIDVVSGDGDLLDATLSTGQYKNVLVHLLDEKMWAVLSKHIDNIKVTVWVHGAEIQVWQRRQFEFERMNAEEIKRQKRLSDKRLKFWRMVLTQPHPNLKLVFVSDYFAKEVSQDFRIDLEKVDYEIVHNYIDGNVFEFKKKGPEFRKRLLSIRPYASRKYANDLTVKAILELSKRDFFNDLDIALFGDGELFEEITSPLKKFSNVKLERRFLSHKEIAELHKEYGVFITPTRMDSQGVSRDEAMSSGLVPITTNVTAIPEFVSSECGMLVDGEDYLGMADAIEELYRSPEKFVSLSEAASQRVRMQSGLQQTILKEIEIIRN